MPVFLITLILSFLIDYFLPQWVPWWSFTIVGFISGFSQGKKGLYTFFAGFAAIFFLWLSMAAYMDTLSESRLTIRVSMMLEINSKNMLLLITGLLGGFLGGLSTLSGFLLSSIIFNRNSSS